MLFIVATVAGAKMAIGENGEPLCNIDVDKEYFRQITNDNTVIISLESFGALHECDSRPLEACDPVALRPLIQNMDENATVMYDIERLKRIYPKRNLYLIGGANAFQQLYKECCYAFITHVDVEVPNCNTFFPNLAAEGWKEITRTPTITYKGLPYCFVTYQNPRFIPVD